MQEIPELERWVMTTQRLASLTSEERADYYQTLYQFFGHAIGILIDVDRDVNMALSGAEFHAYNAASNSFEALLDALGCLNEFLDPN